MALRGAEEIDAPEGSLSGLPEEGDSGIYRQYGALL